MSIYQWHNQAGQIDVKDSNDKWYHGYCVLLPFDVREPKKPTSVLLSYTIGGVLTKLVT